MQEAAHLDATYPEWGRYHPGSRMPCVLCIDPDPQVGEVMGRTLTDLGHGVQYAPTVDAALKILESTTPDLVAIDTGLFLSDPDRLELILQRGSRKIPLLFLEAYDQKPHLSNASRDLSRVRLTKPLRAEAVRLGVAGLLEIDRLRQRGTNSSGLANDSPSTRPIVGSSPALASVMRLIEHVAPARTTVLLEGESGTGKELFSRTIHHLSPRKGGPFVSVNCAALPEGLVESALFGHERGSFTGAHKSLAGAFQRAHHGTLLLDEVTETRLDVQAKLLRAIQEREITPLGGSERVPVDVRIIATTNRNLEDEVGAGRFREDLFYRLRVMPIRIPSLRERREDVPDLTRHYLRLHSQDLGIPQPALTQDAMVWLQQQPWPGNIRELENVLERVVLLAGDCPVTADLLREIVGPSSAAGGRAASGGTGNPRAVSRDLDSVDYATLNLREVERMIIEQALRVTSGHQRRAAGLLGITDRTLRNKLNSYGRRKGN